MESYETHREETHIARNQLIGSNQVDTLQVMAQQYATVAVAVANGGIDENRNERKRKAVLTLQNRQRTKRGMDHGDSPSTAAMTTLNMAVSVAVVILGEIRTEG